MTRAELDILTVTIKTLRNALRKQDTEQEAQDGYDLISAGALLMLSRQIPDENKAPAAYPPAYPASMYE